MFVWCCLMSQSGELLEDLRGHTAAVQSSAFSSDSQCVVWIVFSLCRLFWSVQHELLHLLFLSVQATGSWDRTVRVWKLFEEKEAVTLQGHLGNVACLCFSVSGMLVSSQSRFLIESELWCLIQDKKRNVFPERISSAHRGCISIQFKSKELY